MAKVKKSVKVVKSAKSTKEVKSGKKSKAVEAMAKARAAKKAAAANGEAPAKRRSSKKVNTRLTKNLGENEYNVVVRNDTMKEIEGTILEITADGVKMHHRKVRSKSKLTSFFPMKKINVIEGEVGAEGRILLKELLEPIYSIAGTREVTKLGLIKIKSADGRVAFLNPKSDGDIATCAEGDGSPETGKKKGKKSSKKVVEEDDEDDDDDEDDE